MIIKMNGVIPAGLNDGIASIDIPNDGVITAVLLQIRQISGMDAADDNIEFELSFLSSNTFGSNDTRGVIAGMSVSQQFLTSGGGIGATNLHLGSLNIEVAAGERIHIHGNASAGNAGTAIAFLFIDDGIGIGGVRPRIRRR